MLVRSFMITRVTSTTEDTTAAAALALMEERKFDALPVIRDRRPVGIVTARDVYRQQEADRTVGEVMKPIRPLVPDDVIESAAERVLEHDGVLIPVVDDRGYMVAVVTRTDLLKAFQTMLGAGEAGVRVTLLVPETQGQIERIGRAAERNHVTILSLATLPVEQIGSYQVALRIKTDNPDALIRDFESRHFKVLDVHYFNQQ